MIKKQIRFLSITLILAFFLTPLAFAGDAVTVIFKSGQLVKLDDGFRQIAEAVKATNNSDAPKVMEMTIAGGTFIINVSEVVIVCRDNCSPLTLQHQLDPKRGATNTTNFSVQNNKIETQR